MRLAVAAMVALAAATPSAAAPTLADATVLAGPAIPPGLTDAQLELAVRAAYAGAAAFAAAHGNYFARDGVFAPLHDAVAADLKAAGLEVAVPDTAFPDLDAARTCLPARGAELRIATNTYGDGIVLAAVTDTRLFAYDYDPHKAADIRIVSGEPCGKP